MASETMNGSYALQNGQGYGGAEHNFETPSAAQAAPAGNEYNGNGNAATPAKQDQQLSTDEIAWYFVEQYYTVLSKNPEKLFLYYQKQSQFVLGTEAQKVAVCVGQKAIHQRVTELDFQDCKVRVSNVDSQDARGNIVVQVIGEISNKGQPSRKFAQTFVLASQTQGYFVLNDILRYIDLIEDEEYDGAEEPTGPPANMAASGHQQAAPAAEESAAKSLAHDDALEQTDKKLEAAKDENDQIEPTVNGHAAAVEEAAPVPETATAALEAETGLAVEPAALEAETKETVAQPEKPAEPEPTPAVTPPKQAQTSPAAAPKPSGPRSWATIASGNQATRIAPVVPAAPAAAPPAATQSAKSAPTTTAPQSTPQPTTASAFVPPASQPERTGTPNSGSEWQTAGQEHSRKQSRLQGGHNQPPAENSRGYIKGVTENISDADLLAAIGPICTPTLIDISRHKSCAFVDFASPADYRAAVAAGPYTIHGVSLYVEERKIRPATGPGSYASRGGMRGGNRGGAPYGGQGQSRGGMQKDGAPRGNYSGRSRGSGGPRGGARGGAGQAAA